KAAPSDCPWDNRCQHVSLRNCVSWSRCQSCRQPRRPVPSVLPAPFPERRQAQSRRPRPPRNQHRTFCPPFANDVVGTFWPCATGSRNWLRTKKCGTVAALLSARSDACEQASPPALARALLQYLDGRQHLAFEKFEECAAAGGDIADLIAQIILGDGRQRVATAGDRERGRPCNRARQGFGSMREV